MKRLEVDLWSAAIESNLAHQTTLQHTRENTWAKNHTCWGGNLSIDLRSCRHAFQTCCQQLLYAAHLQYSKKPIFYLKSVHGRRAHNHRCHGWFCSEGGTEFGNVIVVKSKDKHGRCFPCYLFIEGLSLCQSLWILLTQIFLVEVKEKLWVPISILPVATGMDVLSWCFQWSPFNPIINM